MTREDPLGRVVFALLVIACFAAFFVTQRLKHTPTVVQNFRMTPAFSPTPAGHLKREQISFRLARADAVSVMIIDTAKTVIATLVRDRPVARYKQFSLRWNGRLGTARRFEAARTPSGRPIVAPINEGALAPAGEYRVRVSLREQGRTVESPRGFALVR